MGQPESGTKGKYSAGWNMLLLKYFLIVGFITLFLHCFYIAAICLRCGYIKILNNTQENIITSGVMTVLKSQVPCFMENNFPHIVSNPLYDLYVAYLHKNRC